MAAFPGWIGAVLFRIGAPPTVANQTFMSQWHAHEQSACANNPLNTTLHRFQGTNCVHVSGAVWVQRYPTAADGANATVSTLESSFYTHIVQALKSGDPFTVFYSQLVAQELRKWGSTSFATWYLAHLQTLPPAPPPSSGGVNVPTPGTRASKAWLQLLRAMNRTVPDDLRSTRQATARLLHR